MSDTLPKKITKFYSRIKIYIPNTYYNIIWRRVTKNSITILDTGCGQGGPIGFLKKYIPASIIIGADSFIPYLKECKQKKLYSDLVQCDFNYLPFRDNAFNTILCLGVIEHFAKNDGLKFLNKIEKIAHKCVISCGAFNYPQEAIDGNPHQVHRSRWKAYEFKKLGYTVRGTDGFKWIMIRVRHVHLIRQLIYHLIGLSTIVFPIVNRLSPINASTIICVKETIA